MSGVEIRQRAASKGQRGGRRGQEGQPIPLHVYRASWSTVQTLLTLSVPNLRRHLSSAFLF